MLARVLVPLGLLLSSCSTFLVQRVAGLELEDLEHGLQLGFADHAKVAGSEDGTTFSLGSGRLSLLATGNPTDHGVCLRLGLEAQQARFQDEYGRLDGAYLWLVDQLGYRATLETPLGQLGLAVGPQLELGFQTTPEDWYEDARYPLYDLPNLLLNGAFFGELSLRPPDSSWSAFGQVRSRWFSDDRIRLEPEQYALVGIGYRF